MSNIQTGGSSAKHVKARPTHHGAPQQCFYFSQKSAPHRAASSVVFNFSLRKTVDRLECPCFALFPLQRLKEMFYCIWTEVFDWRLCLTITPHHHIAVTANLMLLRSPGGAFNGVELRSCNLSGESLKVRIDNERDRQLLVVVLESEFVFSLFWHLHPDCTLANPSAL